MRFETMLTTNKRNYFPTKVFHSLTLSMLLLILSACGSGNNDPDATAKEIAIEKIADYAQNGSDEPTLQDYIDAGITGVDATNLSELNSAVEQLIYDDVDTEAEIQLLADSLGVVIPNIAPIATEDNIEAVENITLVIDVLGNDNDPDGSLNNASVSITTVASNGSTSINTTTGEVTYIPTANFADIDSFAYTVEDNLGLVSNETTVTIDVDVDTDADGKGNKYDLDDDGDGFSDVDEIAALSDPLDPNSIPTTPPVADAAFKIKVQGDLFSIYAASFYSYNYNVDCNNDGVNEVVNQTSSYSCSYPTVGEYTISITGIFPYFRGGSNGIAFNAEKLLSVEQWGTGEWLSFASSFTDAKNMTLSATDTPNLSKVTNMSSAFTRASLFNGDISDWDVSNVTHMNEMFALATSFNADLSSWDVGNVLYMNSMFYDSSSFDQDISDWEVGKVINMRGMFSGASLFNSEIGGWDVSNVESMAKMFSTTPPIAPFNGRSSFNQNISSWNVSKVTDMSYMFNNATDFDQNIGIWDVSKVTNMISMFNGAIGFDGNIGGWNVSSVGNMFNMFTNAESFNQPIGSWDVRSVTNMNNMFRDASSFDQNLGSWNVSNVGSMLNMFDFLSTANYNSILQGWSSLSSLKPNVILDCDNCIYSGEATRDARNYLTTDVNGPMWEINDAGAQNPVP